jgi:hypothetical protein
MAQMKCCCHPWYERIHGGYHALLIACLMVCAGHLAVALFALAFYAAALLLGWQP